MTINIKNTYTQSYLVHIFLQFKPQFYFEICLVSIQLVEYINMNNNNKFAKSSFYCAGLLY